MYSCDSDDLEGELNHTAMMVWEIELHCTIGTMQEMYLTSLLTQPSGREGA